MKNNRNQHIDHALKKAFAQLEQKAPGRVWSSIQESLDNSMVDETIDKKVHDSFASDLTQAPPSLWDAIDQQLPNTLPNDDLRLDEKINEFYRYQENIPLPESVWKAVNRQLNIDRTWKYIAAKLDQKSLVSNWRKKMLQFFAAASVLLLLAKNCTNDMSPTAFVQTTQYEVLGPHTTPQKIKSVNISASNQELFKFEQNKVPVLAQEFSQIRWKQVEELVALTEDQAVSKIKYTVPKLLESFSDVSKEFQKTQIIAAVANQTNNSLTPISRSIFVPSTNDDLVEVSVQGPSLTDPIVRLNALKELIIRPLNQRELSNQAISIEPIQLLGAPILSNVKAIGGLFQAGAFIVLNATMLLNNDTRSGFDEGSLVQNYYGMAANYGVYLSCRLYPKGALMAEFSVNADNKQSYGVYERGSYYLKEWVMKYNRFSLAYQHDFLGSKTHKKIPIKLVGQLGIYAGFLREAKLFYDGDLKFDGLQEHHRIDFGFKLALGQEIYLDRFVLGYGLRSDFGIVNIFKGNTSLNSNENNTNIIHLGGYLSIGYRF